MHVYITFGQAHTHRIGGKTFDADTIAKIPCTSTHEGRQKAFDLFGPQFFTNYTEEQIEAMLEKFPQMCIKTINL